MTTGYIIFQIQYTFNGLFNTTEKHFINANFYFIAFKLPGVVDSFLIQTQSKGVKYEIVVKS